MSYFSSLFFQDISLFLIGSKPPANSSYIDLVTVLDVMLTSRQTREKLQCLYENIISNNFRRTAVLKKISVVTRALLLSIPLKKLRALHALGDLEPLL